MERIYQLASCTKVWPIIKNNDNDIVFEFLFNKENAQPMLYNSKTKSYNKIDELPLHSHLTVLFWCSSRVNFEYRLKEQPRENQKSFRMTNFCMKNSEILSEVDLSLWRSGIQNQGIFKIDPNSGSDCWFKTKTIYHVRRPYEPLSLKQLCHTELLSHSLKKNFKGKEKIDVTTIASEKRSPDR